MKKKEKLELTLDHDRLKQLSKEELVDLVLTLACQIEQLKQEIERLKLNASLDSRLTSKPPSHDLLKKSEQVPHSSQESPENPSKRKPGGQPGHIGKTRKGFGRVDRFEILPPHFCHYCGQEDFVSEAIKVETQQVAQLVARPIEIVEYHRYTCVCAQCGYSQAADCSKELVPGQDLGIRLQAFLGWLNNYGHLSYEKQQELLRELGQIEIGVGTLVATNQRIDEAVDGSIKELKKWIQQTQPNIHVDETPWGVKGIKE